MLEHRFNHTSWVPVVTPIDRVKSVRNRCVIEVFGGDFFFVLSRCFLDLSVGVTPCDIKYFSHFLKKFLSLGYRSRLPRCL